MKKHTIEKGRRGVVQKLVLESIAAAGVLSIALVAPNVLGAMHKTGIVPIQRQEETIARARITLLKKGLLMRNKKGHLELTNRGKVVLDTIRARENVRKRRPWWDKKWRILIFDIPEHRRAIRTRLRRTLQNRGFEYLQDSVWVYPYPCEEFIALLKSDFRIGKDMLYLVVESMEGSEVLKKKFSLK